MLAIIGGYLFTASLTTLLALFSTWLMPRAEAAVLMGMLAFVIYLVVLIWAFAEPRLARLWLVLIGGGLFCAALTYLLGFSGVI
ncbi:MAG: hypothetical protein AAF512_15840 [Pseudomonadota bacterium]